MQVLWVLLGCATGQVVYLHNALPVSGQTPADGYEIPHLLASVSGIVNRNGSNFFYLWGRSDETWLSRLQKTWLANRTIVNLTTIEDVVNTFLHSFNGVVVYDSNVPQTSVVASTAAGHESFLPLCYRPNDPTSLYVRISSLLPVRLNLVGMFNGSQSGSAKADALLWAKARYLDSATAPVNLAYYLDYFWTREAQVGPYVLNTVGNHDYFISRKAFFFDLSPWADEAPNDEPNQPLGTDQATLKAIFLAAYKAAGGSFIHLGGFPPWAFKYVTPYGKHQGVETEWYFARIASGYNVYMDADACCVHDFSNAAFYQHYPLNPSYTQNKGSFSRAELQQMGYLDAEGKVVPAHYYMFYVGDYDSASWVYNNMWDFWQDPARGKIPLGWALDPNLVDRFPVMFDIMLSSLTANDRLIAGDSGGGYVNPDALLNGQCRQSGLPSAVNGWIQYNTPLYQRFDYNFTGFLINGDCGDLSTEAEAMYQPFSSAGVVAQSGSPHMTGILPVLSHDSDLPADVQQAVAVMLPILQAATPTSFHVFRSILVSPSYHLQVHDLVQQQQPNAKILDPIVLASLLSYTF